jgi:hypothetical protein
MNADPAERPAAPPRHVLDTEIMGGPDKPGHNIR